MTEEQIDYVVKTLKEGIAKAKGNQIMWPFERTV